IGDKKMSATYDEMALEMNIDEDDMYRVLSQPLTDVERLEGVVNILEGILEDHRLFAASEHLSPRRKAWWEARVQQKEAVLEAKRQELAEAIAAEEQGR